MQFRKAPVVVEAMLFNDETKNQVYSWAKDIQMNVYHSWEGDGNTPCLIVPTLEGEMTCSVGDYLIKEPFPTDWRKLYPCKPDIFAKTYEPADASPLLQEAAEWVRVADNLHENITVQTNDCTIDVLVRTDNADSPVAVAFYNKKRKEWWLSEKDDVELTVSHWMKLPALSAPPKPNNEIK